MVNVLALKDNLNQLTALSRDGILWQVAKFSLRLICKL